MFLPGKYHGQRSLVGYSPQDHKQPDTTEWPNNNSNYTRGWPLAGTQKMFTDGREKKKGRKEGREEGKNGEREEGQLTRCDFQQSPSLSGWVGGSASWGTLPVGVSQGSGSSKTSLLHHGDLPPASALLFLFLPAALGKGAELSEEESKRDWGGEHRGGALLQDRRRALKKCHLGSLKE